LNISYLTNTFKSINISLVFCLSALILFFICITKARSAERQLDAHNHGFGELNVAIEGQTVVIELNSPAFNIVGFEHSPETNKDKAAIKDAVSVLNDGSKLFLFPTTAGCRLASVHIGSSLIDGQHSAHKNHDGDHKDSKHDDHKDHDDDHKDSKHDDHKERDIHSEFQANYKFQCDVVEKVNTIQIMIFKHFPNTRQLDVKTILPNGQSAMKLTPASNLLSF
jgi:hypothetical protein